MKTVKKSPISLLAALSLLAAAPLAQAAAVPQQRPAQRVLVFPFTAIHLAEDDAWMGKSVTENLLTSLSQSNAYNPSTYAGKLVVEDNQAAARNARQTNYPLAIRGTIQVVESQVRLSAQLIDSRNGNSVRTAIATGPVSDLLKVEDDLSAQLLGQKAAGNSLAAADPAVGGTGQPPIQIFIQNTPGVGTDLNYPYAPAGAYPNYSYPYSTVGYGPYYPGYYPGIIYITDGNNHHHHDGDHGHGHDHDGDHDGGGGGGIHFETTGPQNGPNTPGSAMSPGTISSDPDFHPVYTRPALPGPVPGSGVNVPFTARPVAPVAAPAPAPQSAAPARVGTGDPRSGR
jgi:TolB-like protein